MDYKTIPLNSHLKYNDSGPGSFEGYAAVFNNVDLQNERLLPGSCAKHLPDLVKRGYVGWQHGQIPIGTLKSASEDAYGVHVSGEFHTDAEAQRIRRIVKERIERGHQVPMSIGYNVISSRKSYRDNARDLTEVRIFEASLLSGTPANPLAGVSAAKSTGGSMDRDRDVAIMQMKTRSGQQNQSWSKIITSSTQFKESVKWGKKTSVTIPVPALKAAGDPVAGFNTVAFAPSIDPHAYKPSGILELLRQQTIDTTSILISQATYPIVNAAAFISEGASKPETQPRWATTTVKCEEVATWAAVTRQALEDVPGLQQLLNVDLTSALQEKVADELINGSGVTPNILGILAQPGVQTVAFTSGASLLDSLYAGIDAVQSNGYGTVNGIVLNPTDATSLYQSRLPAGAQYVIAPQLQQYIVIDAHLAQGTALVGDWRFAVLYTRGAVRVEMGYVNNDIINNKMTIAPSWRVGLALSRPQAFAKVALA